MLVSPTKWRPSWHWYLQQSDGHPDPGISNEVTCQWPSWHWYLHHPVHYMSITTIQFITPWHPSWQGYLQQSSVAEVLFRTAPENQNRQNQTVKFGSVLFSPRNSWSCSVLSSYIWEDIQNQVRTSSNRTSSDIILCFQTEAAVCLSECHLFFFIFIWTTQELPNNFKTLV